MDIPIPIQEVISMFRTKRERYAYVQGMRKGIRGGTLFKEPNVKPRQSKQQSPAKINGQSFNTDDFWNAAVKRGYGNK